MSSTSSNIGRRPTKREREQTAREQKAARLRAEALRKQARRRSLIVAGVLLAVIAIGIALFVVIQSAKRDEKTTSGSTPGNIGSNNSIVVGDAGAKVTVVSYEDFQCPVCQAFEKTNAAQLATWVKDGTVKVEYRPIAFLDRASTTKYSTRALNAAAAVVNADPTKFAAFHALLFDNQPAEGSAGLTDAKLASLAGQAGVSGAVVATALKDKTYEGWAAKVTEDSSKAGITGTPTISVNGTKLPETVTSDPSVLKAAVEAAAK